MDGASYNTASAVNEYGIDLEIFKAHTEEIPDLPPARLAEIHIRALQMSQNYVIAMQQQREENYEEQMSTLRKYLDEREKLIDDQRTMIYALLKKDE